MAERQDYIALDWVAGEIGDTLNEAAQALDAYVANREDATKLRFCLTHIHQVHGTLKMVEFFGAALFADEMEKVADSLSQGKIPESHIDDALSVLKNAIVQLPLYLERVKESRHGLPTTLLPVLNDLRAVRGESLLSETALFAPDLPTVESANSIEDLPLTGSELTDVVHKLRQMFQIALLGLIRGRDVRKNLNYLAKVCARLSKLATGCSSQPLWRVCIAVLEGLLNGSIETSVAVKILLRQVDRQIKLIIDQAESALQQPAPESLLKNLLYYVARSKANSRFIKEIKAEYNLGSSLLGEGELDDDILATPDHFAMDSVVQALTAELSEITVALDDAGTDAAKLAEALPLFQRVNDTMAILGMGGSLKLIQEPYTLLAKLLATQNVIDNASVTEIKNQVVTVEQSLRPVKAEKVEEKALFNDSEEAQQHLDKAFYSVVRESRSGLEQAKDAVIEYVATQWDHSCLTDIPTLLDGINGSLKMIPLAVAASVVDSCKQFIEEKLLAEKVVPDWKMLDTLADAITSVDYYLELLLDDVEANNDSILDVAVASVEKMGYPINGDPINDESAEDEIAVDNIPVLSEELMPENSSSDSATELAEENADDEDDGGFDQEIVEIFIEEAEEVLETLQQELPLWKLNADNDEARTIVRRAFHTLKGSSRMVGGFDIGDLAWAVESMLNRILDGSINIDSLRFELIDDVVAKFPAMITAFEQREKIDRESVDYLIECANRLSAEQEPELPVRSMFDSKTNKDQIAVSASNDNDVLPNDDQIESNLDIPIINDVVEASHDLTSNTESTIDDEDVDQELLDIFSAETAIHGKVLDDFIAHCQELAGPAEFSDELQRALHTLKGSANMAEIMPVAEVVIPLEHLVKELRASQLKTDESVVELLQRGSLFIKAGIEQLATTPMQSLPGANDYIDQLNTLCAERLSFAADVQAEENGIPPEALNKFLGSALDIINEISDKLLQWQRNELPVDAYESIALDAGRFVDLAEEVNMEAPVELGKAVKNYYHRAAVTGHVTDAFFNLADLSNETLIDMLDQIAGQQTPAFDPQVLTDIQYFVFSEQPDVSNTDASNDEEIDDLPVVDDSIIDLEGLGEVFSINAEDIDDDVVNALPTIEELSSAEIIHFDVNVDNSSNDDGLSDESVKTDSSTDNSIASDEKIEAAIDSAKTLEIETPEASSTEIQDTDFVSHIEQDSSSSNDISNASDDDIDEEILEIFLEEAEELLEDMDLAIHKWDQERESREPYDDLLRILHTIKGGARLAGQMEIGDASHNFETSLIALDNSGLIVNDVVLSNIQLYQDCLIRQVTTTTAGDKAGPAIDIALNQLNEVEDAGKETDVDKETDIDKTQSISPVVDAADIADEPSTSRQPSFAPVPPEKEEPLKVVPFIANADGDNNSLAATKTLDRAAEYNDPAAKKGPQEMVKVTAQLLEELVNLAGETSISRGRAEEQVSELVFSLDEMQITVDRLQEQVRRLDMETEQQILYRQEQVESEGLEGFDPLEMDRYSQLQQLSRSLLESSSDLIDIKSTLSDKSRDMETLLVQQSRINTDLQEGLMRSRMVPFARMVPRLRRIIRQVSGELNKKVDLRLDNVEGELDRTVLERMVAPLEHMLRNAVDHGIETVDERIAAGKSEKGIVSLALSREGGEIVLTLTDDGRGVDLIAVKDKAIERGLMEAEADLTEHEILQFILQAGFSTATTVTQISGRGVGMDVVHSEIKQLGGTMDIESRKGQGTRFIVRLPFTVSVNRALMVNVGGDSYAIPLNSIEGIVRVSPFELEAYYQPEAPMFEYAGQPYLLRYMGALLQRGEKPILEGQIMPLPVVLVRGAEHSVAIQVDGLMGSREIVVKPLGPQFSMVQGLSGATVLGDGSVVVILDLMAMIRADATHLHRDLHLGQTTEETEDRSLKVMVVDDSVTVRKVTSRLLERQGMEVVLAKDGVDAVTQLNEIERLPDVMLLDIEMPRMDGFEVASRVRHTSRLKGIPIIMITSRTGEKHRERALSIGVNEYIGKPFQESHLLETINILTDSVTE